MATRTSARRPKPTAVFLFRVATETRSYYADDMSGAGAAAEPGRWNLKDEHVLYAAPSVALATLETAAHVEPDSLPLNKFLVQVAVPPIAWKRRLVLDVAPLGPAWKAIPPGVTSARAGSEWLRARRSALLMVPSVIAPEEHCVLINPAHPDVTGLRAVVLRSIEYDVLFR